MPQIKVIAEIGYVTDTETSVWKIGDISGHFDGDTLEEYIRSNGSDQLIVHLAKLQAQVIEMQRSINLVEILQNSHGYETMYE